MAEMGKEVTRGGLFLNKRDTIAYLFIYFYFFIFYLFDTKREREHKQGV